MRGTETVTVHRPLPGGENRFGEQAGGWADTVVEGCIILPREAPGAAEPGFRQATVIIGLVIYAPPGTDVQATDEVTARGDRWRVDGEPGDYRSAGGQRKIVAINLVRAEG